MKIHHLSCGTMCPYGGKLMDGTTPGMGPACLVCHCLLLETSQGLVLVDTGFGIIDLLHPEKRLSTFFRALNRPEQNVEAAAIQQIQKLGYRPADVRHIVLTHLDFDHAGGISDFPHAKVHVFKNEYQQAIIKKGFINTRRYSQQQWAGHENWAMYEATGEQWYGFNAVRDLEGLPPEILMIPLIGHTWGHCGIAINTGEGWMLLAGDAYFNSGEMDLIHPHCPAGASVYQSMMEVDRNSRLINQQRLRELIHFHGHQVKVCCSHDPAELALLQRTGSTIRETFREREHPKSRPEYNPGLNY